MAKNDKKSGDQATTTATPPKVALPAGYVDQSDDLVGFWDPELHPTVHFIPQEAKVFDSQIEKTKSSVLVIGTLVDGQKLALAKNEGEVIGKPGDRVGIWAKPGMKALKDNKGVRTLIIPAGEKDTGKPNPMKLFTVASATKGDVLYITEDRRVHSADTDLMFELAPRLQARAARASGRSDADDSVPFA